VSLNLKNPRAYELAAELSKITGESLTTAVINALEQRLASERQKAGGKSKADRIRAFAARFAEGIDPTLKSEDHALIYDEYGLPK
jgi:antitoxin VapB